MKILDLEIIFKRNKQKHYPLIISCNLHILMKWSLLTFASSFYFRGSTCFYILLKTKCSQKQPPEVFATLLKRDSNTVVLLWNFPNFCEHLFWTLSINDCSCEVWFRGVATRKCRNTKNKNLNLTFFSLPKNRKVALCEEHFDESCFSRSVDLGRRLMNGED